MLERGKPFVEQMVLQFLLSSCVLELIDYKHIWIPPSFIISLITPKLSDILFSAHLVKNSLLDGDERLYKRFKCL